MRSTEYLSIVCFWAALATTLAAATPDSGVREHAGTPNASVRISEQAASDTDGLSWRILPSLRAREPSETPPEMRRDPFLDRRPPQSAEKQALSPPVKSSNVQIGRPGPSDAQQAVPLRYPIQPTADYRRVGRDRGPAIERTYAPVGGERPTKIGAETRGQHIVPGGDSRQHQQSPARPAPRISNAIAGSARTQPPQENMTPRPAPSVARRSRQPASGEVVYTMKDGRLHVRRSPPGATPGTAGRTTAPLGNRMLQPVSSHRQPAGLGSTAVARDTAAVTPAAASVADKPTVLDRMRGWLPGQGAEAEADGEPEPASELAETESENPSFVDRVRDIRPPKWMAFGRGDPTVNR
jgi:hypothetical protein